MINRDRNRDKKDVWLVRHCQTVPQQAGLLQRRDTTLSEAGRKQASVLAAYLCLIDRFVALYSSPLPRAMETAERIAEALKLETMVIEDLREIDFGQAGGLSLEEFRQHWPALASMWDNPFNLDFQWPGGESRKAFHIRSLRAIHTLVRAHQGERIIVVAHTGNLCGYLAHLFLDDAIRWREFPLRPASISRVVIGPDEARLLLLDDMSHLHNSEAWQSNFLSKMY